MDEWVRWALGIVVTVFLAMFGWLLKMISTKANRESTDKRFDALLEEIQQQRQDLKDHESEDRAMHKDVLAEIRETNRHLSTTNATLSNLVGRFYATNGHRNNV